MTRASFVLLIALFGFADPALAVVGAAKDGEAFADRVVMVLARRGGRESVCSGVALGPRVVLTAAHCLAEPADMLVAIRAQGRTLPTPVAAAARHPGYDPQGPVQRRVSVDLALVETTRPLEGLRGVEIGPAPALGATVTLVGFGVTLENGPPSDGRPRTAALEVAAPASRVTLWAHDPDGAGLGACHGDSGGPLFDGEGRVVAVVAWTNGTGGRGCGAITQGPLAAPAAEWIAATEAKWER